MVTHRRWDIRLDLLDPAGSLGPVVSNPFSLRA